MTAYVEEYGFFDADHVILVLGSDDVADCPTFAPLDPRTHPTRAPPFAAYEALARYLPRLLSIGGRAAAAGDPVDLARCSEASRAALARLLEDANRAGRHVAVIHHPDRNEAMTGTYRAGFQTIKDAALRGSATFVEARAYMSACKIEDCYRDAIHINAAGQRLYARILMDLVAGEATSPSPAR
jgi:hypothetical protein